MSQRYAVVRGSATAASVCVMHPASDESTGRTASATIIPVSASVGNSAEVNSNV